MALAKITTYNLALFVHVASIVIAFGVIFAYPVITAFVGRGGPRALAAWHRAQLTIGRTFISIGMLIALLAGVYLATEGPYDFGEWWVGTGLLIVIVIGGIGGAYFSPTERKLIELAERDDANGAAEPGADYTALAATYARVGYFATALVVFALFIMATKPGSPS